MPLKTTSDEQPSLNLTPMIDIVFLLIIFFMVGTRFSELNDLEKQLPISVPEVSAGTALTAPPKQKVIHVFQDGRIHFEDQDVNLSDLTSKLKDAKQAYRKQGVVIRGDASSQHQTVVSVINACRQADIIDIAVSVRIAVDSNSERSIPR
ncbi:MAG: biopolymer transporter ExbD [Planctomycetaceae bacterium]|jgi:biopolymer transport protein ExbD|nr:biopolymer transporter ExbD [Planctomycetaceae bacterium]